MSSLMDDKSHEMHVYDWRSPIASVFYRFGTGKAFYEAPAGKIKGEVDLKRQYESIGLICKTEKDAAFLYQRLKDRVDVQLIKNDGKPDLRGVFIIPVYLSKGLEFDAVLICDADEEHFSTADDKRLLYIACTRALHRLSLFYTGAASPLL